MTQATRPEDGEPARYLRRAPQQPPRSLPGQRRSRRRLPVVLIADDTTDTRDLYADYFQARGFSVVTAPDGATAVHAAREYVPDVIVMDLAMPQIDGITAVRRIKADARTQRSRVILLTGYPHRVVEWGAFEAGADLFLTKPCLPEVLERYVNRLRRPRRSVQRKTPP
jgi:two-component system, cell cycle response regulator DivK